MLENLTDKSLTIIDDDEPFVRRLSKAMEKRGFIVSHALNISDGKKLVKYHPPAFAVVDLKLSDGNGLEVVEQIRKVRPDSKIIVLTGYGAIATAVAAVKIGATDYLAKPADAVSYTHLTLPTKA